MYYSSTSFLAWCLNHYFYNGTHYTWAAGDFYPYRQNNPKSSNPLLIYIDLYEPWKDKDTYDKFIAQHRMNLRKGVLAQQKSHALKASTAKRLKKICDKIDMAFFYPLVYRIDTSKIAPARLTTAASGAAAGSNEVKIEDLGETEFEVLLWDGSDAPFSDPVCAQLKAGGLGQAVALTHLESKC